MRRSRIVLCSLVLVLGTTFSAWTVAQDSSTSSSETMLDRVGSYLDKSTVFVGYFDLKKIDVEKSIGTLRGIVDGSMEKSELPKEMKDMLKPMFAQGIDALEKELKEGESAAFLGSGCEELFVIVNSMTMAQSSARLVFTFDPSIETAKIDALREKLATTSPNVRFQRKDDFLVGDVFQPQLSETDRQAAEKFVASFDKSRKPLTRPELLAGMDRTKSAPFKLVFAPDAALKGMLQIGLAMAPPEVQQALPAKTIVAGVHWISLGIDVNRWIIDLNIKSESPEAAQALHDAVVKLKDDSMAKNTENLPAQFKEQAEQQMKIVNEQFMRFMPKVQEDRLRLTINQKFVDEHFPSLIQLALPGIMAARAAAQQFVPQGQP